MGIFKRHHKPHQVKIFIPYGDVVPLGVARSVKEELHLKGCDPSMAKGERIWSETTRKKREYILMNTPVHDKYEYQDLVRCMGFHNGMPIVIENLTKKMKEKANDKVNPVRK